MCIHLDRSRPSTEHDNVALMTLLTGHGEFESIDPREASLPARISDQPQPTKRHVTVEQFDIHLLAMPPHRCQRALADAMGMPEPGGRSHQQQEDEQIAERYHKRCAPRRPAKAD